MRPHGQRRSTEPKRCGSPSSPNIDLDAIAANYRTLCELAAPAECAAVVKADAYGLGMAQVAPVLWRIGCKTFFVATIEEGKRLRALLPDAIVYVLGGLMPGTAELYWAHDLRPVLNSADEVEEWASFCKAEGERFACAVHIDTGMNRLGLSAEEVDRVAAADLWSALDLALVMSHLACADEPDHPLNPAQLRDFTAFRAAFPMFMASLANSSGIFLGPDYHFDLVRPGCALYGINPTPGRPNPMRTAARLWGKVLQIHEVDPPRSVGYGATHRVAGRTRIATVAAGYADGWPRALSNRGSAFVGDIRVPVIGRVSMDLITLDVSAVPQLRAGDTVELLIFAAARDCFRPIIEQR